MINLFISLTPFEIQQYIHIAEFRTNLSLAILVQANFSTQNFLSLAQKLIRRLVGRHNGHILK